jgi:histidinol-phosphate/aromatic aminotransferase/cobyric acid decarboxylase-like protein
MFVVAQLTAGKAAAFCDTLRHKHGILIKALGGQGSGQGYDDRIRIGLGSRAKLERLLEAIGNDRPDRTA